ncbi:MAG: long-chain-acyl-CoA synthetase [Gammaproteobacteria bacterium]|nr:long-chain-acyl-CoA synthetase [Gammaproteobacteria bacterium]MDE0274153.1 long-chain-acyl-CoA synthetase [Gammaproteobacteria bacterium]
MGLRDAISTLVQVPALLALKKELKPRPYTDKDCFARQVESNAVRFGERTAIVFEGRSVTWAQFNALANRYANHLASQGVVRGDVVSVVMENRIEFLAVTVALNKLGATAGFINTNLRGRPLVHCITVTESKKCVFGEELAPALAEVKSELPLAEGRDYLFVPDGGEAAAPNWAADLDAESAAVSADNPPTTAENTLGDTAMYLFTSGTTGLPKAAVMSNRRYLASAAMSHKAGLKCTEKDRLYICLPLYHGTGLLVGCGAAFGSGASLFIRRKFSASNFLADVREHQTTCLVYIGELCRYLMNTPAAADDHQNPLKHMIGNGLRPDVWLPFKQRFGIKRITEFYGASEGNVAFANLLNKDQTVGMTASEVALVAYDVDADEIVKDDAGRCIRAEPGEPGLLLGQINEEAAFEGYTNPEATERKILRNAFEDGDAWFNTGDLLREVDAGFTLGYPHYQFVDRVGDTFRWKSENVSTNEVGEIINGFGGIQFCNVYGVEVPGTDGRAGMAALVLEPGMAALDTEAFSRYVTSELPAYARPVFLRVQSDIDVTGTFKMLKGHLRKEGYDLSQVAERLYVMKPGSTAYERLDQPFANRIRAGEAGY